MIAEEIQKIARDENVPVFGIGSASEMADEPPGFRPEDFMPGVQSLICLGIPIPRDVYCTPTYSLEIVWRSQNLLYRRLDTLALRFSSLLEERGDRAIPIYGCMPLGVNKKGTVVGYVNQMRMAEAAARYMSITSFDEHTFHICSKCVSLCPYGNKNECSV